MYDTIAVQPMRDELTWIGFEELLTSDAVNNALTEPDKTVFVMINSVCGCAAGSARPGVALALQHNIIPDRLVTVFAGQDHDAVDRVRAYLTEYPPSSPFFVLFRNAQPIFVLQRSQIQGQSPEQIASTLQQAFDQLCTRQGSSVPKERYDELVFAKMCGSKIPRMN
jgi:putative YphP/YqiW family bacilliredoxin